MTTPQSPIRKICCNCKADVSQTKRVKDDAGQYYCHPCWQQQTTSRTASSAPSNAKTPCGICGALTEPDLLWRDQGLMVCDECFEKRQGQNEERQQQGVKPRMRQYIIWGLLIAMFVLVLVIMALVLMLYTRH